MPKEAALKAKAEAAERRAAADHFHRIVAHRIAEAKAQRVELLGAQERAQLQGQAIIMASTSDL